MRPERLTVLFLGLLAAACGGSEDSVGDCSSFKPHDEVVDLAEAGVLDGGADAGADGGSGFFCAENCPPSAGLESCKVTGTTLSCHYNPICPGGRRPEGYCPPALDSMDEERAFLGSMAHLEHASVGAFRRLRRELSHYGAPKALVRAAERSARDEVRHYRLMRRLLERRGGVAKPAGPAPREVRRLEDIATENAVEGCVHETYGALLAHRQAAQAADPVLRQAMMRIARDETRHAALAWKIAHWLDGRLTPAARERVRSARAAAARELAERERGADFATARRPLGLPEPDEAQRLVGELTQRLWS